MSKSTAAQQPPEDEGDRSFSRFLALLADGEAEAVLSNELRELAVACREAAQRTGKGIGVLTLKLGLSADAGGSVTIAYVTDVKKPKRLTSKGTFWQTEGGNLTPENPRQQKLPLRDVGGLRATIEMRETPGAAAAREAGARLAANRAKAVSVADIEDAARTAEHEAAAAEAE